MKLDGLTNVTVVGKGEVEIYGEGAGDFMLIQNSSNIRIENLTMKGNRPSVPDEGEFRLFSTVLLRGTNYQLHFERCRIIGFGNHGISHLYSAKRSFNMVVTNCYFADGGDGEVAVLDEDGAAVSGISSGARIVNNTVDRCFRGFEIEGVYNGQITNVVIEGNIITNCYGSGVMLFATDHLGLARRDSYSDIRIINNRISNIRPHPEYAPYPRIVLGMILLGGERVLIANNIVETGSPAIGIWVGALQGGVKDVQIVSNTVRNIHLRGIQVTDGGKGLEDAIIAYNTIHDTGDEGILLAGKNIHCYSNIVENTAFVGERASISLMGGSANAVITDNVIRNRDLTFSDYGVWLFAGTTNTVIYGNTFALVPSAIRNDGSGNRVQPKIHSMGNIGSTMTIQASGLPGTNYRLERSTDLGSWNRVAEVTCPTSTSFEFEFAIDPSRLTPNQYFRVLSTMD